MGNWKLGTGNRGEARSGQRRPAAPKARESVSCCQLELQQVGRCHGWRPRLPSMRKRDGSAVQAIRRRPVLGMSKMPFLPRHPWSVINGVPLTAIQP
jgi:hypothetical protein